MPPRQLNPAERLDWLRLIRSENVGPVTFYQLLRRFGSASAALEKLPELANRGGRRAPLTLFPRAQAERELADLARVGATLLAWANRTIPLRSPRSTTPRHCSPSGAIRRCSAAAPSRWSARATPRPTGGALPATWQAS